MRSTKNVEVTFGSFRMTVGIAPSVTEKAMPTFTALHAKCSSQISKKIVGQKAVPVATPVTGAGKAVDWCETCGEEAVEQLKGYEYAKGQFLIFKPEEMELLKEEHQASLRIEKFVPRDSINPLMVESHHFLLPDAKPAEQMNYGIIYQALADTKLAGFGHQAFWGKDHPCMVVADQSFGRSVLMLVSLYPYEDLVHPDFRAPIPASKVRTQAKATINSRKETFDPVADLVSYTRRRKQDAIAAKMDGKAIEARGEDEVPVVRDALEALKESLLTTKKAAAKKSPAKRAVIK